LRRYFLLTSAATITVTLVLAALVLVSLFSNSLERRVHGELTNYVNQIAAGINFAGDGALQPPTGLSDQRFDKAYSGLYWQIDDPDWKTQLRSRSLWDYVIPLPVDDHDAGAIHRYTLEGPEESNLVVEERSLVVSTPVGARTIRIAVALDQSTIVEARTRFGLDMIPYLLALGGLLFLASLAQLLIGLKPLSTLTEGLDSIRDRKSRRLEGRLPSEFQDLADAVNKLLSAQELALANARKRSGDLAHGLKTPLTVIRNHASRLSERGENQDGSEISALVVQMEHHIHHELVRSRLAPSPELRQSDACPHEIVEELVKTLKKTPEGERLDWATEVAQGILVAVDPHDLRELLGNILENAGKWAKTTVTTRGMMMPETLELRVEDDGPGLDPSQIQAMLDRGKRFDEKTAGSGIGLSIVRDICDLYQLPLTIQNRQSNGLVITLSLPVVMQTAGMKQGRSDRQIRYTGVWRRSELRSCTFAQIAQSVCFHSITLSILASLRWDWALACIQRHPCSIGRRFAVLQQCVDAIPFAGKGFELLAFQHPALGQANAHWIDLVAVDDDFVMQMWPGGQAG
jgi:signal transduction histidine kinase